MFLKQIYIKIPKNTQVSITKVNLLLFSFNKVLKSLDLNKQLTFMCFKSGYLVLFLKLKTFNKNLLFFKILKNNFAETLKMLTIADKKSLKLIGIGYKAVLLKNKLQNVLSLKLGFSHMFFIKIPKCILIKIVKQNLYLVCHDRLKLLQFCNLLRNLKLPDIYKGKGFFFEYETIVLKKGKKN